MTAIAESLKLAGGRTFIAGREGHIYINDPAASKHHAEIKFEGQNAYVRDLASTNGTYLLKQDKLIQFKEGYIRLDQPIVIGANIYTPRQMLKGIQALLFG